MDISVIDDYVLDIKGWLHFPLESNYLYMCADKVKNGNNILEIGCYEGKSTIVMAFGLIGKDSKIYTIDNFLHDTYKKAKNNLKKFNNDYDNKIRLIVGESTEEARFNDNISNIELLFIDGAHDFHSVKNDYYHWIDYVVKDGLILFHDSIDNEYRFLGSDCDGVIKFVEWLTNSSDRVRLIGKVGTISTFKKVK